jgi:glutamate 5-kinase
MPTQERKRALGAARRIVVKVGTTTLTEGGRALSRSRIAALSEDLAMACRGGREAILVSSGAVVGGLECLGLKERPRSIPGKQAAAAVGQNHLMDLYTEAFGKCAIKVGQVLLTHADISDRGRFLNARATLLTLLRYKVLPIVNENDTVAVDEIKFGDNDNLAAAVAHLVGADLLVILTDTDGLYDRDPREHEGARLLATLTEMDKRRIPLPAKRQGAQGTGGVATKLSAAQKAARFGIPTVVANGSAPGILSRILAGEAVGTLCLPSTAVLSGRKSWIAYHLRPQGTIAVDAGARAAIEKRGKSLLPSGIVSVAGHFRAGDPVKIVGPGGEAFAHGLAGFSADELRKIRGAKSSEIAGILGVKAQEEAIHRDNLVVIATGERR